MRNKMTKKMPICWKCASAVIVPNDDSKSHGLESCKEEPKIKDYQDAENMCPLLPQKTVLCINGGVASVIVMPENSILEIRDYDVEGMWDEANEGCKVDSDGDRYQEIIFDSTE